MKLQALLESNDVSHGAVVKMVYDLALDAIKCDAKTRSTVAAIIRSTDSFWSETIDDVTSSLRKYIEGRHETDGIVLDEFHNAICTVGENIVEYMTNPMNFPPGYDKPEISFSEDDVHNDDMINALHKFAGFSSMHNAMKKAEQDKEKARKKAITDSITPELLQRMSDFIDTNWPKAFSEEQLKKIKKKPKWFAPDWFSEKQIASMQTPEDILKAFSKKDQEKFIEWVLDAGKGFPKEYHTYIHVMSTPKLRAKVIQLNQNLKNFFS